MSEVAWPSEIEKKSTISKEIKEEPSSGFASFWPSQQNKDKKKKKAAVILEDFSDQGSNEGEIDWLNVGKRKETEKPMDRDNDQRPIRPNAESPYQEDRPIKPMREPATFDEDRPIQPMKSPPAMFDEDRPIRPRVESEMDERPIKPQV